MESPTHAWAAATFNLTMPQVVVVVSNKLLNFETMHMLAYLGISHEHLDLSPWERADGTPSSGKRQRVRSRREGLSNFRLGEARVLVLNLLVSRVQNCYDPHLSCWLFVTEAANARGNVCM
jgi:hypothetical protein